MSSSVHIPQPKTFGPLGNLPQLNLEEPVQSMVKLSNEYGPIFRMDLPGRSEIFISSYELVEDACDESRFDKRVWAPLRKVRAFAGDGLFTSETEEPNWRKAHNILLPSFSQRAMQGYHNMMVDLALQLIQKWGRLNPDESVNVPEDMTRLTLDTIGLCGFNYRFNSFYRDQPHPFITSMVRALNEAMNQLQRLGLQDKLMVITKRQYKHDIQAMFSLVDKMIAERKAHGLQGGEDLLAHMLSGKDPDTGEALDDENIRYQIITFLIAGHETTSGLLSFAIYYLLKNPEKLSKAYEEVDRVLTDPIPSYTQVRELKYIRMILNEALRLWPTAPAFSLYAKEDTMLAGKYPLKKGDSVNVLIPKLHRDTDVWGDNVEEFVPERFEDPSQIPYHAYKPFGNGQRACIGQQFALQEATLVLGMVLKHFEIIDHTNYQLKVKETLTLKPDDFTMRVRSRGAHAGFAFAAPGAEPAAGSKQQAVETASAQVEAHHTPLLVLYGSNLGTAEGIARELADTARYQGFVSEVAPLNDRVGKLPKEGAVFIISASYNGKPPSNAREFVQWLEGVEPGELEGVRYAVFGCGDHNWAGTYQQVPRLIDEQLAAKGATRLAVRGEADASGDFEKQIEEWGDLLWPDVLQAFGLKIGGQAQKQERSTLSVQFVSGLVGTPLADSYEAQLATVVANRELQQPGSGRSTRHLEIRLPEGVAYQEGDHLGVIPENAPELVDRVLRRFGLHASDHIIISASGRSAAHLPLDRPISVQDLLGHSVELQEAATRAQLRELAAFTVCPPHKKELEALLQEDAYKEEVLGKRLTMLELLEQYPACELPFERFIELLPPLKPRYYSISSSPKAGADTASITVGVVRGPAKSGRGEYRGVASNYLAGRREQDAVVLFVRTPESGFQLPQQTETPIVMVGPGTGVAPFRGFLQARRALRQEGHTLGEARLYFGCRHPEQDYLYREELEQYERDGLVKLHTAFSRMEGHAKTYVQDMLKRDGAEIVGLLDRGAILYVCGDGSRMAPGVEAALREAYREVHGAAEETAASWLDGLQTEGRYVKDVWAGL
ncbi:bifunctional cytochrome P450/NADPH--P450 reductase [Paenibacillus doosanensis]|uniref:bifunctional cytochrome P450/NADPH--P450 reductase n=1 Tax=Paenibacillus doosanensis TaxID=1229154 RepID=UPI0021801FDB|nr:bifunctional cytochrome P450/NADPH--P450 reductase [Paenibacillus doosanensis]MCS7462143.1 bifunctional cytochrome P450/NADPH--P450 reductase [Paenibacillus doosanensis]